MYNLSRQAKKGKCYICGKDCSSYCNSHSIPQFVLDNLSKKGQYGTFAATSGMNFLKPTIGKNKAGTFHLICRECDSVFFSEYENKDVYLDFEKALPPLFFSKINIKNLLYLIDKMNEELSLLTALIRSGKTENPIYIKNVEAQCRIACEKLKRYEQLYQ